MTFATIMFAAVCALTRPTTFSGDAKEGVCMDVQESVAFTASVWVQAASAGSDEVPYPLYTRRF